MKHIMSICMFLFMVLVTSFAYAQGVSEPVQSIGDKVLAFIGGISPQVMLVLVGALEFGLRALKTQKPISVLRGIIATGKYVCNVVLSVLSFLDKIIPQNVESYVPGVQQKLK